jgi:small subunit ribosomal protein S2
MKQTTSKTRAKSARKTETPNLLKAGDVLNLNITAVGAKNTALAELPNGFTVVLPEGQVGDQVRCKISKVMTGAVKYATANVLDYVTSSTLTLPVRVGQRITATISKAGPKESGLISLDNNFTVIVPKAANHVNDTVSVIMTRVKSTYAFGTLLESRGLQAKSATLKEAGSFQLQAGTKFQIEIPSTVKTYNNYFVFQFKGTVLFLRQGLGVQPGDKVLMKLTKIDARFVVGQILKVSPLSSQQQKAMIQTEVRTMIQTGLHFGKKTVRCHANMRPYLWIRKKGKNADRPFVKRGRHTINVLRTRRCLHHSLMQLAKYAAKGKTFLFVGTKKSAASLIAKTSLLTQTSFYVNTRWLGGMLTNWKTILKSIAQIRPILKEKQRLIRTLLEKRQQIKERLIFKVNLLRERSRQLVTKGQLLMAKLTKSQADSNHQDLIQTSQALILKREQLLARTQLLVQKYTSLTQQSQKIAEQTALLRQKGQKLVEQKTNLLAQHQYYQHKFQEFQQLARIATQLVELETQNAKEGNQVWTLSYNQFAQVAQESWGVPNPSPEVLNAMINAMKTRYDIFNSNTLFASAAKNGGKAIVMSKLVHKFVTFLPFLTKSMEVTQERLLAIQKTLKSIQNDLQTVKADFAKFEALNTEVTSQLTLIKSKLLSEQETLRVLKLKLRRLAAEQRLLQFLPRLRSLPTLSQNAKMVETIQVLMRKFVDPRLTYSMDTVYDQRLRLTSKKMAALRKHKWQRLETYFGGVTKMAKMGRKQISNNVAIIIGQQEELNTVRECQKLGIKMFTIVDTNSNPRLSDHVIPANDDSRNTMKYILGEMLTYIRLAQKLRQKVAKRQPVRLAFAKAA